MPFDRPAAMRKLFHLGRQLGLDKDAIRSIAAQVLDIPSDEISLARITDSQLGRLLDHFSPQVQTSGPAAVRNSATKRQIWLIGQLETQLGMKANPKRLAGFIRRQTGNRKEKLTELTRWEASKVIEGLKQLANRPAADTRTAPPPPVATVHEIWPGLPDRPSYRIADLAISLGISNRTLYRLINQGHLPATRKGRLVRIPRESVVNYLQSAAR